MTRLPETISSKPATARTSSRRRTFSASSRSFERGDLGDPAPEGGLGLPPVDRVREDRADEAKARGVGRRPVAVAAEAPRCQDRGQPPPDVEGHRQERPHSGLGDVSALGFGDLRRKVLGHPGEPDLPAGRELAEEPGNCRSWDTSYVSTPGRATTWADRGRAPFLVVSDEAGAVGAEGVQHLEKRPVDRSLHLVGRKVDEAGGKRRDEVLEAPKLLHAGIISGKAGPTKVRGSANIGGLTNRPDTSEC